MAEAKKIGSEDGAKQPRLTNQQLILLKFIYSYRFVATRQVQWYLGKRQIQQAQQRLNTLLAKEYIGRRFTSEDRLLGRYASYFLLPAGLKLLKSYGSPQALKNMRKDATASDRFIKHSLAIGDVVADLVQMHPVIAEHCFWTKTDMMRGDRTYFKEHEELFFEHYPQPLPDLLLGLDDGNGYLEYLIEIWHDDVPFWVYRKRVKYYIDYVMQDTWSKAYSWAMPKVLIICDSATLQRRLQRFLRRTLSNSYVGDELAFLITSREALHESDGDSAIWSYLDGRDMVIDSFTGHKARNQAM